MDKCTWDSYFGEKAKSIRQVAEFFRTESWISVTDDVDRSDQKFLAYLGIEQQKLQEAANSVTKAMRTELVKSALDFMSSWKDVSNLPYLKLGASDWRDMPESIVVGKDDPLILRLVWSTGHSQRFAINYLSSPPSKVCDGLVHWKREELLSFIDQVNNMCSNLFAFAEMDNALPLSIELNRFNLVDLGWENDRVVYIEAILKTEEPTAEKFTQIFGDDYVTQELLRVAPGMCMRAVQTRQRTFNLCEFFDGSAETPVEIAIQGLAAFRKQSLQEFVGQRRRAWFDQAFD